jgi:transcription elongation factor Elf1
MAPVYTSGAFLQQCFSVHPLCLSLKKLIAPQHLVLSCSSCQMSHRLTVRSLMTHLPGQDQPMDSQGQPAFDHLTACMEAHRTALGISVMDVVREAAGIRCAECRRIYDLDVSKFETHQR